ncbi:hypothetical protein NE237_026036 [Protea cynaroides]|uniref:Small auxin up regulated protein n=1 Tax=Protea cynaroides TaxID=273540 RepID=A0A9Q0K1W4_9MAGN|nr:hypothetical protein NE237_026036 [Protea cynaroides]
MTHRRSTTDTIINGLKKNEIWQMKDPFRVLMLLQQKAQIKMGHLPAYEENSMESLLAGDVSRFGNASQNPGEVPRGSLAVYVGPNLRRYIVPATYLSLPEFRVLMERAVEEFGFEQEGGLKIPCEEEDFEEVLLKCMMQQKLKKGKK